MITLTLKQIERSNHKALVELVNEAGSEIHLSRMLCVARSTVAGWGDRRQISAQGARLVGDHPTLGQKFSVKDLRCDIELLANIVVCKKDLYEVIDDVKNHGACGAAYLLERILKNG